MTVFVVLGGGLLDDGTLPQHVKKRIQFLLPLQADGDVIIFSALYSLNIRPLIDEMGFPRSEAKSMKDYYLLHSKPIRTRVFIENASFDTMGAALFIRKLFDFLIFNDEIVIITSDFHKPRAKYLFHNIWDLRPKISTNSLKVIGITDEQNDFTSRIEKENLALANAKIVLEGFQLLDEFTNWLFTEHDNYKDFKSKIMIQRGEKNVLNY